MPKSARRIGDFSSGSRPALRGPLETSPAGPVVLYEAHWRLLQRVPSCSTKPIGDFSSGSRPALRGASSCSTRGLGDLSEGSRRALQGVLETFSAISDTSLVLVVYSTEPVEDIAGSFFLSGWTPNATHHHRSNIVAPEQICRRPKRSDSPACVMLL